jgi:hypothetical protein
VRVVLAQLVKTLLIMSRSMQKMEKGPFLRFLMELQFLRLAVVEARQERLRMDRSAGMELRAVEVPDITAIPMQIKYLWLHQEAMALLDWDSMVAVA